MGRYERKNGKRRSTRWCWGLVVSFPEPGWQEERTHFRRLFSDLHTRAEALYTHKEREKGKEGQILKKVFFKRAICRVLY